MYDAHIHIENSHINFCNLNVDNARIFINELINIDNFRNFFDKWDNFDSYLLENEPIELNRLVLPKIITPYEPQSFLAANIKKLVNNVIIVCKKYGHDLTLTLKIFYDGKVAVYWVVIANNIIDVTQKINDAIDNIDACAKMDSLKFLNI